VEDQLVVRRRKLAEIRHKLQAQTTTDPFSLSTLLASGETISDFVTQIAVNIHKKRSKSRVKSI
jgi:hypothetical protein